MNAYLNCNFPKLFLIISLFILFCDFIWSDNPTEKGFSHSKLNDAKLKKVESKIGVREIIWQNKPIKVWFKQENHNGVIAETKYNKKPKEMSSEEARKHKEEREQVKKLMAEYKLRVKDEMEKRDKELENDEQFKAVMEEIKAAQAKNLWEETKPAMSIPDINSRNEHELYQGDIELSLEQAQFLLNNIQTGQRPTDHMMTSSRASRVKRGVVSNPQKFPNRKWPLYVPFSFDSTIPDQMKNNIYLAVQTWNDNTCLTMVEDGSASPRIQFTNVAGEGCSSYVGIQPESTYQHISLEYPDCDRVGYIVHEIGHALGFFHEHQRGDRDSFIWYLHINIQPEAYHNFVKTTIDEYDNFNVAYDFGSIMHYHSKGYSRNSLYTMMPKAGAHYINTIGQRLSPSINDYVQMNKYYCGLELFADGSSLNSEKCSVKLTCNNGGFQNPKNCSDCICPSGYIGSQCQDVDTVGYAPAGIPNTCTGQIIFAISHWQDLRGNVGSDALDSNNDYAYCHWQILAGNGESIDIEVVDVGTVCSDGCFFGNTEIRTKKNKGSTGVRLCCRLDLGFFGKLRITAPNGYAMISLYSLKNVQSFHIRFRLTPQGSALMKALDNIVKLQI